MSKNFEPMAMRARRLGAAAAMASAVLLTCSVQLSAQNYRWRRVEQWTMHQVFGLDCGRGGPCFAAVTYLLEQGSLVRRSTDNGQSWHDVLNIDRSSDQFPGQITRVAAVGSRSVFAGYSDGLISVSSDAGASWEFRRVLDTGWILTLRMLDETRGIALVQTNFELKRYTALLTRDAWRTSSELTLPDSVPIADTMRARVGPRVYPTGAAIVDPDTYVVIFRAGPATTAAKTTDRGSTWRFQQFGSDDIEHLRFATPLIGWAYGGRVYRLLSDSLPSVYRTTDGGDTWELSLVGSRVTDLNVRGREVVAVADQKRVYSSDDGGLTWRRDSADVRGADIYYTAFPDSGDAIIGTASGTWLVSNGIASAVEREDAKAAALHVWLDERSGRLVVDHGASLRETHVVMYDAAGRRVASLSADVVTLERTTFDLSVIEAPAGRYFVTVVTEGAHAHTVLLQR